MSGTEHWPVAYRNELLVGNLGKSVGVCTLWSDREFVADKIGRDKVAVVGNLYSHGPGIEGIVRNIAANPRIRTIVLAGKDKSRSGETLITFFRQGVDSGQRGHVIPLAEGIKTNDLPPGRRTLDSAISVEAIERLRENVKIVDMRGREWSEVAETVVTAPDLPAYDEPKVYPKSENKVEVMGGEDVGFVFRGAEPSKMWSEILRVHLKIKQPEQYA